MHRLDVIDKAANHGASVLLFCSFRSSVDPLIIARISQLKGVAFLLRDQLSLQNFKDQTGRNAIYFPDLFNFCELNATARVLACRRQLEGVRRHGSSLVGLNFSEQSLRSFFDEHSNDNRQDFVARVIRSIRAAFRHPFFVLISNDTRSWRYLPSGHSYQLCAEELLCQQGMQDSYALLDPHISYPELIVLTGSMDDAVTGRMHLSLAFLGSGALPIVMMGCGKGYTNIDKMQGMFRDYFGDAELVCDVIDSLPLCLDALNSKVGFYHRQLESNHIRHLRSSASWGAMLNQQIAA